jgi:hypothetical protein
MSEMTIAEAIESEDPRIRLQGWMWVLADVESPCAEIASAESATRGRVTLDTKLLYHLLGQVLLGGE